MTAPDACAHEEFKASCDVGRLSEKDGGPINGYTVGVRIECVRCGVPFRFIGLAAGNHYAEPRVSVDGCELRAPIEPATHDVFAPHASYSMPPRNRQ